MEHSYDPIKKENLSKIIQDRILLLIREGAIVPNEKVPSERELCERFQVSRTSIREAMKGLISLGILEKRSDGTYVRENTSDIVREPIHALIKAQRLSMEKVTEARAAIECQMVRIAAEKAQKEDIKICRNILTEISKSTDIRLIITKKAEFHMQIAKTTKNDIMIAMYSVLYDIINTFRVPEGEETIAIDKTPRTTHEEILSCIERGDPDAAEIAMRKHLSGIYNYEL